MPMKLISALIFCIPLVTALDYDSAFDPHDPKLRIEQNHYLDFPVMRKDFSNWQTVGAAVMLKNKAVLAPEVRDKKGIIYSQLPNPVPQNWLLDISFDIGNTQRTMRGGTGLGVFYVKSVDQEHVSHKESIFGYTNRFEGLGIYVNTVLKGEGSTGKKGEVLTAIQGFVNDGTRAVNVFAERKHLCWRSLRNRGQPMHMRIQYAAPLVTVLVFDTETQSYSFCFSFETPMIDFPGHFLLSGSSGVHNPDHVYLHSVKLYDTKTASGNEHFKDARRTKSEHELAQKLQAGVKDLFEKHSDADIGGFKFVGNLTRDESKFIKSVPLQHNQLIHKVKEVFTQVSANNDMFFENMRGIPQVDAYNQLKEKLFNFRLKVDQVNQELDKDLKSLSTFEKSLKLVKHTNNLQKGLLQREVNNPSTKKLQFDLQEVERVFQQISVEFRDYQQAMEALGQKVRKEAGFTQRLEDERRQFAKEMSGRLFYDMKDIEDVFNEMELQVVSTGGGLSSMILNIGMVLVIIVSAMLWKKMNTFETKNE